MSKHAPGPCRLGAIDLYEVGEGDKQGIAIVATDGSIICDNQTYYPKPLDPANAPPNCSRAHSFGRHYGSHRA